MMGTGISSGVLVRLAHANNQIMAVAQDMQSLLELVYKLLSWIGCFHSGNGFAENLMWLPYMTNAP